MRHRLASVRFSGSRENARLVVVSARHSPLPVRPGPLPHSPGMARTGLYGDACGLLPRLATNLPCSSQFQGVTVQGLTALLVRPSASGAVGQLRPVATLGRVCGGVGGQGIPRVGRSSVDGRRKARPEPETDAHPGAPDPRRADDTLPGQPRGHARGDVVPADDGRVHGRGVRADEDGYGIGLGTPARPRPGARGAEAADDETGAAASVTHRAARRCVSRPPRARGPAFLQGYILTGATP